MVGTRGMGDAVVAALGGKSLGPVPLLHELLVPEIAVNFALGIDAATGVAIVMPDTADIVGCFNTQYPVAHLAKPIGLIKTGEPGADHHCIEVWCHRHFNTLSCRQASGPAVIRH